MRRTVELTEAEVLEAIRSYVSGHGLLPNCEDLPTTVEYEVEIDEKVYHSRVQRFKLLNLTYCVEGAPQKIRAEPKCGSFDDEY